MRYHPASSENHTPLSARIDINVLQTKEAESQFSTRRAGATLSVCEQSNVVYSFKCSEDSFNASYVGYSTNELSTRIKQHRYSQSSIYKHYVTDHDESPTKYDVLKDCFSIIYKIQDTTSVKIAEAVMIKNLCPLINVEYSDTTNLLKLF